MSQTIKFYTMKKLTHYLATAAIGLAVMTTATSCKKEDDDMNNGPMRSMTYMYDFNNGQVVPTAAYEGKHMDNLMATMKVEELADGGSRVTVTLQNTVNGAMYMAHAHDAADPTTTPNGTPYNEAPNSNVFNQMFDGNGGTVSKSQNTNLSFDELTNNYNGFFVVHDPLQAISTTNISTYLIVGTFARAQPTVNYNRAEFSYAFNTGQLVPAFAYAGTHANTLSAKLTIQELGNGGTRVGIALMNTINGQMYLAHTHDMADPATTPNGTPYIESPNGDILNVHLHGTGGTVFNSQLSAMSIGSLTSNYDGFLVVHDPLQPVSTTDPTTYVILGVFGRN
jgi:hypothetical protein